MQKSIAETTRAATAMEGVAQSAAISAAASRESVATLKEVTAKQMRAYLSVVIGGGIYQEKAKNLRFEVRPLLVNTGNTPAHKVSYWAKAAIFDWPLSDNFSLPAGEDEIKSGFVLGPHQNLILNAMIPDYLDEAEAERIKVGKERRLYIWGRVTYVDVFGEERFTHFSHNIFWLGPPGQEIISGNYVARHNEAI